MTYPGVLRKLEPGDPVCGYWLAPSCLVCGGQLHHVADGTAGHTVQATAECWACERLYRLGAVMVDVTEEVDRPSANTRKKQKWRAKQAAKAEAGEEAA